MVALLFCGLPVPLFWRRVGGVVLLVLLCLDLAVVGLVRYYVVVGVDVDAVFQGRWAASCLSPCFSPLFFGAF